MAGAGERFSIGSISAATSLMICQNDYLPTRFPLGGLNLCFNANSNWLGTVSVDNGVGITDITSLLTNAGSVGGAAGQKLFRVVNFYPWKVWLNVSSVAGNVNYSVSM
jgi:hypothetical protein